MSSPHEAFETATARHEYVRRGGDRLVPLAAAIIAVLAAIGTLLAHHQSIAALSAKNEAILLQSKAADQYGYYEAKRLKFTIFSALIQSGNVHGAAAQKQFTASANHESTSSLAILAKARDLEREATGRIAHSEALLQAFETYETATMLFEISIVFVSVSALSETRLLLYGGAVLSLLGIALAVAGYVQAR